MSVAVKVGVGNKLTISEIAVGKPRIKEIIAVMPTIIAITILLLLRIFSSRVSFLFCRLLLDVDIITSGINLLICTVLRRPTRA